MRTLNDSGGSVVYAITAGKATSDDFDASAERILVQMRTAISEKVNLIQIREKLLSGKQLYEVTSMCSALTRGTSTKLLLNDRADIALSAGADGVHLTETSIPTAVIRKTLGDKLIIGVSVHSKERAVAAGRDGADFAVYGPVFDTPGKGEAIGLESLSGACALAAPFPIIGLGGIDASNCGSVVRAGAAGVAGIRAFGNEKGLRAIREALDHD